MVQVSPNTKQWFAWFPKLRQEIWILFAGQLLLFMGQGFTLVYSSIFFVNALGFSATQVGLALGSGGISGLLGRFVAGAVVDSPIFGRRITLLASSIVSAIASFVLAFASTLPALVTGNILLGLGVGLYWPTTMVMTTDLTTDTNRTEAFALTRLADNLGIGLGALIAGQYIALSGSYRALFLAKGAIYLIFGLIIYWTIAETLQLHASSSTSSSSEVTSVTSATSTISLSSLSTDPTALADSAKTVITPSHLSQSVVGAIKDWWEALGDRPFTLFLLANIFFTTYAAQLSSTLPLYLVNFIPSGNTDTGFSEQWISYFFLWHALLKVIFQLPLTRWVKPISNATVLCISLSLWLSGLTLIWVTGVLSTYAVVAIISAFSLIAFGEILYGPSAMTFIGDIAPITKRGTYFSLDSQCWAVGYLIGPILGGWALDHPTLFGVHFWLILVAAGAIAGVSLIALKRQLVAAQ